MKLLPLDTGAYDLSISPIIDLDISPPSCFASNRHIKVLQFPRVLYYSRANPVVGKILVFLTNTMVAGSKIKKYDKAVTFLNQAETW